MLNLKIPPGVVFIICMGLMWLIKENLHSSILKFEGHLLLAFGCFAVGVIIGLLAVIEFIRKRTTVNPHKPENSSKLVTSGVYTYSRNPMYLALLIALISAVLYWGNPFILVVLPIFVWYMNEFQIKPEEEIMEQKFGVEFSEYKKKVRRWL
ncbi:methyltransferase family protein [Gracilimonas sp. Q87]|uniref:methyltransferase family protein n=1 Tax=Gracilimonas sp. Q87 TaxID=3384766 RepID=UPI00398431F1